MVKLNRILRPRARTHEGAVAQRVDAYRELRRSVLACMLWEDTFYESGEEIGARIGRLIREVEKERVAALAVEARAKMQLRHAPLLLARELARTPGSGTVVAETLEQVIQRADEPAEFLALYWKEKRQPLSAGVKRGLARAMRKFDAYALAKYNRDGAVRLRDVLFLIHARPKDEAQAADWKALAENTLALPDTWEVALSRGDDKKTAWERLLREGKLGGLAVLRNLRNMQQAGVDTRLIRARLDQGIARALPFRFIAAARHAPALEDAIEAAMLKAIRGLDAFPGATLLLVDVSGSMAGPLSVRSETTRIDAAAGLAILLREKAERCGVYTFSERCVAVPARRGFALRDAITASQPNGGTYLARALQELRRSTSGFDRIIVVTDEQSHDGIERAWLPRSYVVNVAPYQHGVSYGNGWTHVDGFSERVLEYIALAEREGEA